MGDTHDTQVFEVGINGGVIKLRIRAMKGFPNCLQVSPAHTTTNEGFYNFVGALTTATVKGDLSVLRMFCSQLEKFGRSRGLEILPPIVVSEKKPGMLQPKERPFLIVSFGKKRYLPFDELFLRRFV